jgi:hypothetical protein
MEYIVLEDTWNLCRVVMEWCGLALCSCITLESLLCTTSPFQYDTCTLKWMCHLCGLQGLI